jgi:hypothetical protein
MWSIFQSSCTNISFDNNNNNNNKKIIKYINFIFGLLMLIVLVLHVESLVHVQRYKNSFKMAAYKEAIETNFGTFNFDIKNGTNKHSTTEDNTLKENRQCFDCIIDGIEIITNYNIIGILLSILFVILSFILTFKMNYLNEIKLILFPVIIVSIISSIAFLIIVSLTQTPKNCLDLSLSCNDLFKYQLDFKIIPSSLIMISIIPEVSHSYFIISILLFLNTLIHHYLVDIIDGFSDFQKV